MSQTERQPSTLHPDPLGAFVPQAPFGDYGAGSGAGPLAGETLAVKDLFDVAGLRTGAGAPAWLAAAVPAAADAPAVARLLEAGAAFVGKTITDELAWSLNGENVHYGTPVNPRAPGRIPGGSSAGSAAAVSGELVSLALGSDTGGSVRMPASYCGILGLRPTHGRISLDGVVALAPSYDTVGWFTRDAATLAAAGAVLFGTAVPATHGFTAALLASDAFDRVEPDCRAALEAQARRAAAVVAEAEDVVLAPGGDGLAGWRNVFRVVQSSEVWATHGDWVERSEPEFGPGIRDRFRAAATLAPAEIDQASGERVAIAERMSELVGTDRVVILPGAASPPPVCGLIGAPLDAIRNRALEILCPAGHAGLPCLALPAIDTGDGPLGLAIVGPAGSDERLLALAPLLVAALHKA